MSAILGETLVFGQHTGGDIRLRVFGDEFYARYETTDGYTVVYDVDCGQYSYAVLQNGRSGPTWRVRAVQTAAS